MRMGSGLLSAPVQAMPLRSRPWAQVDRADCHTAVLKDESIGDPEG